MVLRHAPLRLPRAGVLALTVLTLAAAAHVGAGGQLPAPAIMMALAAVVGLSAVLLAGLKMTAPLLAAYLGGAQLSLHLAFSTLSAGAVPGSEPSHHGPGLAAGPLMLESAATHQHLMADAGSPMTFAHVIATLATALLLARGEAALWALAAWLRPLNGPIDPVIIPPGFRQPLRTRRPLPPGVTVPVQTVVRGPPPRLGCS
ncbi:hypothetical protein ACIQF8_18375 [Pseudarthrobacter sp. NPDC092184]|uniref:hypothetical protein n=1 Tax=Pseudarthrobacter TaxID=1742993 RepID=UPI00168A93DE|nr:hypothetical protein [Pseudarthrobacter sp. BIM B-2242]QOD02005.1 hypothetical protein IDT60_11385 [Pseudarthrobacter sp. BIM B-2242]BFE45649.1 hypothetical protein GCM10017547_35420 [Pseudarthrobacter oxydans]